MNKIQETILVYLLGITSLIIFGGSVLMYFVNKGR